MDSTGSGERLVASSNNKFLQNFRTLVETLCLLTLIKIVRSRKNVNNAKLISLCENHAGFINRHGDCAKNFV